jgi:hypothetical protein
MERCGRGARLFVNLADAAVKEEDGRAGFERGDLYVLPRDAARPACLQGFERRFFGGEACGIMLRGDHAARVAVGTLARCEHALGKTRRAPEDFTDAPNFDNVYADGNNHR